jgi:hypothetical protein
MSKEGIGSLLSENPAGAERKPVLTEGRTLTTEE